MIVYTSLNSICTRRGPLMGPRSLVLKKLRSLAPLIILSLLMSALLGVGCVGAAIEARAGVDAISCLSVRWEA